MICTSELAVDESVGSTSSLNIGLPACDGESVRGKHVYHALVERVRGTGDTHGTHARMCMYTCNMHMHMHIRACVYAVHVYHAVHVCTMLTPALTPALTLHSLSLSKAGKPMFKELVLPTDSSTASSEVQITEPKV